MLKPLSNSKWSYTTAAHLLNRAGFGGTPAEIEKVLRMGLDGAVSRFVDYETIEDNTPDPDWAKPDPDRAEKFLAARRAPEEERRQKLRAIQQADRQHMLELRGWWLQRMAHGPRPFQEKNGPVLARPFCNERRKSPGSLPHVAAERALQTYGGRQL